MRHRRYCLRGHDTWRLGRSGSGNCRGCDDDRARAARARKIEAGAEPRAMLRGRHWADNLADALERAELRQLEVDHEFEVIGSPAPVRLEGHVLGSSEGDRILADAPYLHERVAVLATAVERSVLSTGRPDPRAAERDRVTQHGRRRRYRRRAAA